MNRITTIALTLLALVVSSAATGWAQDAPDGGGRGWLGISFSRPESGPPGLRVDAVAPGSPAAEAGLRAGDRIVRWNGDADVAEAIRERRLEAGDTVRVRVAREGEAERELAIEAAPMRVLVERRRDGDREIIVLRRDEMLRRLERAQGDLLEGMDSLHARLRTLFEDSLGPRLERFRRRLPSRVEIGGDSLVLFREGLGMAVAGGRSFVAGASVADVTPGLGSYFGTDRGALVLQVAPETPAAEAGLQEGDVIVRANGEEVSSVADLREAIGPPFGAFRARSRPFRRGDDDPDVRGPEPRPREDIALEIIRQRTRYSITIPR